MKTFKDLVFEEHKFVKGGVHASMKFENGNYISVVGGGKDFFLKGNGITSFEIMSSVTEKRPMGVECWLSPEQVTQRMRYLQIKDKKESVGIEEESKDYDSAFRPTFKERFNYE